MLMTVRTAFGRACCAPLVTGLKNCNAGVGGCFAWRWNNTVKTKDLEEMNGPIALQNLVGYCGFGGKPESEAVLPARKD